MELQNSEALAQFTATVVHDFKNVSSAVRSGLGMIVRKTTQPEIVTYANMIGEVIDRGTRMSNRLLTFARTGRDEIVDVDLSDMLEDVAFLLRQAGGSAVEIDIASSEPVIVVRASHDQLELALVNLVVNARDAMNGEGKIVIDTLRWDNQVGISVKDTGPDVPDDIRASCSAPISQPKPRDREPGLASPRLPAWRAMREGRSSSKTPRAVAPSSRYS